MSRRFHRSGLHLLALLLLPYWPAGCTPKPQPPVPAGHPLVRVRLLEGQSEVNVAGSNSVAFREAPGVSPRPLNVARKQPVSVRRTGSGWRIGDVTVDALELTFVPVGDGGHLSVNGKPYRGDFRLVPAGPGKFDVVNDVDIEGYLKGVLAKELLRDWHEEAYRAQAIVARTYALYEVGTAGAGRAWDVHPDERSQVYGGMGAENGLSVSATDATTGVVVAFGPKGQERIFKAYFSACCGGISQSVADGFSMPPFPPLSDKNVEARCRESTWFNWEPFSISKDDFTRRLRAWGAAKNRPEKDMAPLARLDIAFANRWGRPVRFTATDAKGQRYSLSGTEIRAAINTNAAPGTRVYSSFFTPVDEPDAVRIVDGHGNGHGVGMCQYCVEAQAEAGVRHEDIVLDAYPGATLQRAY